MKNTFKLILSLTVFALFAFNTPTNDPKKTINVVIDAGHGGQDHGVMIEGFSEKEIVAKITEKIRKNNTNANVVIHLTRQDDQFISLQDRAKFINEIKPDLVLSLHVNSNKNTDASGVEFYVSPKNVTYAYAKTIAEKLNSSFITKHSFKSRGVNEANYLILRDTEFPSVTVELGFLSNKNDRSYLTSEVEQEKIANTILEVISKL